MRMHLSEGCRFLTTCGVAYLRRIGEIYGNGTFYEFIRENEELFPGLNAKDQNAMKHANGLCQEVFTMNEDEISDNYTA